ncbi:MAG: tRNA lysidine(34) synthetase TilS [Cyanobium sp.]
MAERILPSGPETEDRNWSADHQRLHRSLLRRPDLLPRGAPLLLAVSGGQDSIAMTALLRDLVPLHRWRLHLWHGDHGWRPESARQAGELAAWAAAQGLPLQLERWAHPDAPGNREAAARLWRYGCLQRQALRLGCRHVLTAHTASDRAETVLLHLARGSHRRGLAALRRQQPLASLLAAMAIPGGQGASGRADAAVQLPPGSAAARVPAPQDAGSDGDWPGVGSGPPGQGGAGDGPEPVHLSPEPKLLLVRPLQIFSRQDTARLCRQWGWPVWRDPLNDDPALSRNRIRAEVLPVLEALHPGASRRISAQAERLAAELEQQQELLDLALAPLGIAPAALDRRALQQLSPATQRLLLQHWLQRVWGRPLESRRLEVLLPRLARGREPGQLDLGGGWRLCWQRTTLALLSPAHPNDVHG